MFEIQKSDDETPRSATGELIEKIEKRQQAVLDNFAKLEKQLGEAVAESKENVKLRDETKGALSDLSAAVKANVAEVRKLEGQMAQAPIGHVGAPPSTRQALEKSERFKQYRSDLTGNCRIEVTKSITAASGLIVSRDAAPELISLPQFSRNLSALVTTVETTSPLIEFTRMTLRTNSAAPVAEGAIKPESDLDFAPASIPVRVQAHVMIASNQMLEDVAGLAALMENEGLYMLEILRESQYLKGTGTGQNVLGIFTQAPTAAYAAVVGNTVLDLIHEDSYELRDAGIEPDGVMMRAGTWGRIERLKDRADRYLWSDPAVLRQPVIWGLPIVTSVALAVDDLLVGAFRRGAVIRQLGPVTALFSSEDRDNFVRNMQTIRIEARSTIAVYMPSAFRKRDTLAIPLI